MASHLSPQVSFGFACKYHSSSKREAEQYNFRTTTRKALSKLTAAERDAKLRGIYETNLGCLERLISYARQESGGQGALRIGSDLFPFFRELQGGMEEYYSRLPGAVDLTISMHPDQFFNIGNANFDHEIIAELYNQARILDRMNSGNYRQDKRACLVLHVGPAAITMADWTSRLRRLPELVRNYLVIENDEFSWGLEKIRASNLQEMLPIVVDFHHDWVHTGRYRNLEQDSDLELLTLFQQSWQRHGFAFSKIHCSMTSEAEMLGWSSMTLPQPTKSKTLLRKHSDMPWNLALVKYYKDMCSQIGFDTVMVEMKNKQVAMQRLEQLWQRV